jgi:predicted transcriptional regulator
VKKKGSFIGSLSGVLHPNLTDTDQEVLSYLSNDFLTIKKIAIRRGCSVRAIQKIVKKLKEKGVLNKDFREVRLWRGTREPYQYTNNHQIRLHSQEFNIKILYKDQRYKEILGKANTTNIDGNTIRLYNNSIEIYSGQSFYADDVQKATANSFDYWNRLFARLENDFKVILIKSRAQNIKLVKQHYAEINNELAQECEKKADKIKVYTTDDGKLWFLIDNSFNLHEAETQGQTAKQDMAETVRPFFNDLRDNNPPRVSIIWKITAENTKAIQTYATIPETYNTSINLLSEQIQLHLNVMNNINDGIKNFNHSVDDLRTAIQPLREKKPNPEQVIDYLFDHPLELAKFKLMSKPEQNKILFGE